MTTSIHLTPPRKPNRALRGGLLVLGAVAVITAVTLLTLDPSMYSMPLVSASALIVAAHITATIVLLARWRIAHRDWATRATAWLLAQGLTAAAAIDLTLPTVAPLRIEAFPDADYLARVEGPLQDTYFVIAGGVPALYEAHGEQFTPRVPREPQSSAIL